jgi:hypothetical protein
MKQQQEQHDYSSSQNPSVRSAYLYSPPVQTSPSELSDERNPVELDASYRRS